jgi:creatine kinase
MGEHTEVVDRIDISNWRRLGFSEFNLVKDMINCANALAKMEDELVAKLPKDPYFDLIMNP